MIDSTQIFDGTLPNTGIAITTSRASTNVLDLLAARDVGAGEPLGVHVLITETFLTCTSLTVDLAVCDTDNGTFLKIISSPVYPVAQLIAGVELFRYALPVNQLLNATAGVLKAPGRYVNLTYTIAGSTATAGKVFSYLNPRGDRNEFTVYSPAYTVAIAAGEVV